MPASSPHLPSGTLEWLTAGVLGPGSRVVVLCPTASFCRAVASRGSEVLAIHHDPTTAAALNRIPGVIGVCASEESLPLDAASFDAVLVHQGFQELAPGLVLPETARVLRPGCTIGVSWLVRDDTVPWVRRLAEVLRDVDRTAMSGDYGTSSVESLVNSKYFPDQEHITKRIWVPVTRDGLISMTVSHPAVQALDEDRRARIVARVAQLHDDACGPSGLRLPYQLECWRAWVNHDELTTPLGGDDGLVIPIH